MPEREEMFSRERIEAAFERVCKKERERCDKYCEQNSFNEETVWERRWQSITYCGALSELLHEIGIF